MQNNFRWLVLSLALPALAACDSGGSSSADCRTSISLDGWTDGLPSGAGYETLHYFVSDTNLCAFDLQSGELFLVDSDVQEPTSAGETGRAFLVGGDGADDSLRLDGAGVAEVVYLADDRIHISSTTELLDDAPVAVVIEEEIDLSALRFFQAFGSVTGAEPGWLLFYDSNGPIWRAVQADTESDILDFKDADVPLSPVIDVESGVLEGWLVFRETEQGIRRLDAQLEDWVVPFESGDGSVFDGGFDDPLVDGFDDPSGVFTAALLESGDSLIASVQNGGAEYEIEFFHYTPEGGEDTPPGALDGWENDRGVLSGVSGSIMRGRPTGFVADGEAVYFMSADEDDAWQVFRADANELVALSDPGPTGSEKLFLKVAGDLVVWGWETADGNWQVLRTDNNAFPGNEVEILSGSDEHSLWSADNDDYATVFTSANGWLFYTLEADCSSPGEGAAECEPGFTAHALEIAGAGEHEFENSQWLAASVLANGYLPTGRVNSIYDQPPTEPLSYAREVFLLEDVEGIYELYAIDATDPEEKVSLGVPPYSVIEMADGGFGPDRLLVSGETGAHLMHLDTRRSNSLKTLLVDDEDAPSSFGLFGGF